MFEDLTYVNDPVKVINAYYILQTSDIPVYELNVRFYMWKCYY